MQDSTDYPAATNEENAIDASTAVRGLARSDAFLSTLEFRKGDLQLLCNHSILHARSGYEDWPEEAGKRRLYRMWVNLPDGRRLAPEFADRTNMGYMAEFHSTTTRSTGPVRRSPPMPDQSATAIFPLEGTRQLSAGGTA